MRRKKKRTKISFRIVFALLFISILLVGCIWHPTIFSYPFEYIGYWGFVLGLYLIFLRFFWLFLWSFPLFVLFNWAGNLGELVKKI
ncbi:MAG: hypothetical protein ACPL1I_05620, partial [bacterium]